MLQSHSKASHHHLLAVTFSPFSPTPPSPTSTCGAERGHQSRHRPAGRKGGGYSLQLVLGVQEGPERKESKFVNEIWCVLGRECRSGTWVGVTHRLPAVTLGARCSRNALWTGMSEKGDGVPRRWGYPWGQGVPMGTHVVALTFLPSGPGSPRSPFSPGGPRYPGSPWSGGMGRCMLPWATQGHQGLPWPRAPTSPVLTRGPLSPGLPGTPASP